MDAYLAEPKSSDDEELSAYEEEHNLAACMMLSAVCLV
jgi:hypothetical protein